MYSFDYNSLSTCVTQSIRFVIVSLLNQRKQDQSLFEFSDSKIFVQISIFILLVNKELSLHLNMLFSENT